MGELGRRSKATVLWIEHFDGGFDHAVDAAGADLAGASGE